jgi:energy-coupling factor transporter ATP-binding protein EcfA2
MSIDSKVNVTISETSKEGKKWFSVKDLMGMADSPQERCLWDPFIPKIGLIALAGPSDCGKSTWARQLALAVALQQEEFLNYPLNVKHGKACYVATEDEHYGTKHVLEKQLNGLGSEGTDALQFIFDSESFLKDLSAFLEENKVDLVVVDAWADLFSGNPNINTDVRQALKPWGELAKKHECCIVMLHHLVKNADKSAPDKNKVIGSQGFEAKLRCVLDLRLGELPSERNLTVLKHNYLPPEAKNKPHVLSLDSDTLLFSNTSKTIACVSNTKSKTYNKGVWIKRFQECRSETDSDRKAIGMLGIKYPGEEIPKRSWFIENVKMMDGRSDSKENDRPTIPAIVKCLSDPDM